MSSILKLITEMRKEDAERKKAYEVLSEKKDKKHKELMERSIACGEKLKKITEGIHNQAHQLINHKHSIDKALQEMDDLPGLPLPHEDHGSFIKCVSEIHSLMNKPDVNTVDTPSIEEIQHDVVLVVKGIIHDSNECKTGFSQAEALYHRAKELKQLDESNDDKDVKLEVSFSN